MLIGKNMKVLLIHLPYFKGQPWSLPLGLAYIAAVLLKAGFEVEVLDIALLTIKGEYSSEDLYQKLKKEKYLFIGFGAVFFDFSYFRKLSEGIREICPNTPQIIGGQWASRIAEVLVNNTNVDAVIMGEGEDVVLKIAESLSNKKPISQLRYVHVKDKPYTDEFAIVEDLNKLPFPARHLFDMDYHKLEIWLPDPLLGFSTILATRGCPRECVFCKPLGGKRLRARDPENIIQEMKELNTKCGIKYFRFNDEGFLGSNRKIIDFCNTLKNSGLNITFSIWSWSHNISEEAISCLKDAGCIRVQLGIESGSPEILKEMNKVQDLEKIKQKIQFISDQGLYVGSGFLTGTPGETEQTLEETKNYIKELNKVRNFEIAKIDFIKFLIGSPIYRTAKEKGIIENDLGFIIDSDKDQMFKFINLTKLDEEKYANMVKNINKELIWDYYSKYKIRILRRLFLCDQIDCKNFIKHLSLKDSSIIIKKIEFVLKDNFYSFLSKCKFLRKKINFKKLGYFDRL
jgi:anaerobic magnesium-protoporphyrin IX monomethyl ester cyclase